MINSFLFVSKKPFVIYYDKDKKMCMSDVINSKINPPVILSSNITAQLSICVHKSKIFILGKTFADEIAIGALKNKSINFKPILTGEDVANHSLVNIDALTVLMIINKNNKKYLLKCIPGVKPEIVDECDSDFLYVYRDKVIYVKNGYFIVIDIIDKRVLNKIPYDVNTLFSDNYYLNSFGIGEIAGGEVIPFKKERVSSFIFCQENNRTQIYTENELFICDLNSNTAIPKTMIENTKLDKMRVFCRNKVFETFYRINNGHLELTYNEYHLYNNSYAEKGSINMENEILTFAKENADAFNDMIDYNSVSVNDATNSNPTTYTGNEYIQKEKERIKRELMQSKNDAHLKQSNYLNNKTSDELIKAIESINTKLDEMISIFKHKKQVAVIKKSKKKRKNGQK